MKRSIIFLSSLLVVLMVGAEVLGQKGCDFSIIGAWRATGSDEAGPALVVFGQDGSVTVYSGSGRVDGSEIAKGTYTLDDAKAPKSITLTAVKAGGFLSEGVISLGIAASDDTSFTSIGPGAESMRWVRAEPFRYFLVLAGREGNSRDGGPAFAMLIRKDGRETLIETAGLYFEKNHKKFGLIPKEVYDEFMREPNSSSDVMLRLEITGAQFQRSLKIMKDWQRRAREGTLLYPPAQTRALNVNTSVLLKQLAEDLNRCGERISLYALTWRDDDEVAVNYNPRQVPFQYLKRLKQLNEKRHVPDSEFAQAGQEANMPHGK